MNRTLTAAVALAATLGVAGLAQAQSYTPGTTGGTTPGSTTTMPPQTPVPAPQTTAPYTTTTPPGATSGGMTSGGFQAGTQGGSQANAQPGAQSRVSAATIQQAQEQLKSQGLYNGPIDGMLGPQMKTALSQYQQRNGLPQSAMLDQETLNRLVGQGGQAGEGAGTLPATTSPGTTR